MQMTALSDAVQTCGNITTERCGDISIDDVNIAENISYHIWYAGSIIYVNWSKTVIGICGYLISCFVASYPPLPAILTSGRQGKQNDFVSDIHLNW